MRILTLALTLLASSASAQSLLTSADMTYLGSFTLPNVGSLQFGGYALGIGPDNTLFFGCTDPSDQIARVSIPEIGAVGTVVEACRTIPNLTAIDPGGTQNGVQLGGSLLWNGRAIVTAFSYYDNTPTAVASHFYGANLTSMAGPVALTVSPRITAGYMGLIPPEWRDDFGGPALTGLSNVNVIDTSSYGPSLSVFNPDDLGVTTPAPATLLMRYTIASPWAYAWRSTGVGGFAWPSGTRSVLFMTRVGGGTPCYGTGGASGGTCVDPTSSVNGYHAYPYVNRVFAYDAQHLLEVKQGTRLPGAVQPVAHWDVADMTEVEGQAQIRSAAYDDTTRRWYVVAAAGGFAPKIHVYQLAAGEEEEPPAAPSLTLSTSLTGTKTTCKVQVTASPPDGTGGWGVQFTLNDAPFGVRDATAPFTRTRSGVPDGSVVGGTWTKVGSTPQVIVYQTIDCPE
jgi:hypothetical protein